MKYICFAILLPSIVWACPNFTGVYEEGKAYLHTIYQVGCESITWTVDNHPESTEIEAELPQVELIQANCIRYDKNSAKEQACWNGNKLKIVRFLAKGPRWEPAYNRYLYWINNTSTLLYEDYLTDGSGQESLVTHLELTPKH